MQRTLGLGQGKSGKSQHLRSHSAMHSSTHNAKLAKAAGVDLALYCMEHSGAYLSVCYSGTLKRCEECALCPYSPQASSQSRLCFHGRWTSEVLSSSGGS